LQWSFNRAAQALHEHREMQTERICKATAELAEKNYQIERASQAKTRLMAAASHDLRQPLHALALLADGLGSGQTEPEQLERIHHVRDCVASLDHLFSELLDISQIDAGLLRPRVSHFELDRVMSEVDRNFRPVAEQRQLRLVCGLPFHGCVRTTRCWCVLSAIWSPMPSNTQSMAGYWLQRVSAASECVSILLTRVWAYTPNISSVFSMSFIRSPPPAAAPNVAWGWAWRLCSA
jgi:signal transduction histidine kinase